MVILDSSRDYRVEKGREEIMSYVSNLVFCDFIKCWKFLVIEIFVKVGNIYVFNYLYII